VSEVQACNRAAGVQLTGLIFGNEDPGYPVPFSFAAGVAIQVSGKAVALLVPLGWWSILHLCGCEQGTGRSGCCALEEKGLCKRDRRGEKVIIVYSGYKPQKLLRTTGEGVPVNPAGM